MISPLAASQSYSLARSAVAPGGVQGADRFTSHQDQTRTQPSTGDRFMAALDSLDTTAQAAMTGKAGTQTLVQTIAETEAALETVVAIRDRVVEAYQEILRMPV